MRGFFVTGTDTDVGKTVVSGLLTLALSEFEKVQYWKPVQSGASEGTDSQSLRDWLGSDGKVVDSLYNFQAPISPNRAAALEGEEIEGSKILRAAQELGETLTVVEGAGGCLVPINSKETILDLMLGLRLPTVVVASTKLGTINHSVLTCKMLAMKGLEPAALVLVGEKDPGLDEILREQLGDLPILEIPKLSEVSKESLRQEVQRNLPLKNFCQSMLNTKDKTTDLEARDRSLIWHPFTQHGTSPVPPEIVSGRGAYLKTRRGETLFDGISSWWVNLHGHGHPAIAEKISGQAHQLEHVIFAGFTHQPAIDLVDTLCKATRERGCSFQRGFFSDNGSTAVEVALKMAYQYHQNKGNHERTRFLSLRGSYHGDTIGAMSVGERGQFHKPFEPLLFEVDAVEPDDLEGLEQQLEKFGHLYSAFILEPMVQGAGGMRFYSSKYLDRVAALCEKYQILTIADEIFTGFFRTGKLFAFEHSNWKPDLICLSKGLTGGFLPLSLTLAPEAVFDAFRSDDVREAFLHGHSYTANPVACAAGLASWDVLNSSETQKQISELVECTANNVAAVGKRPDCVGARSLGTIGAFELAGGGGYFSGSFSKDFHQACLKKETLLRPLGSTIYTLPPYCTTTAELNHVYQTIFSVLEEMRSPK